MRIMAHTPMDDMLVCVFSDTANTVIYFPTKLNDSTNNSSYTTSAKCPSCLPTNSVKALKVMLINQLFIK